ncbi:MAG: choice-of-anchor D domain-containing protein [Bacteroidetes bacterium]|nr:MAG: choice-of-anchor D domain-containing protein [Bacteroidota bacterium]REK00676.1 MAG: choice-of-anchor D domain-containing protein [Bacteroidota bacterium]REK35202.1 MAG: choice-of-anchor D domain-containing protein [Bacteroidota bacterium]REK48279.1 MAG: choice-of-anchor D domain-containing protein [Bacteroidota bacterium]
MYKIRILKFLISTGLLICPALLHGQSLTLNQTQLNFGSVFENSPDSLSLEVINNTGKNINVTGIRFYNTYSEPAFSCSESSFFLADGTSRTVWIKFHPKHNVFHDSEMLIENDGLRGYVNVDLKGQGKYSDSYYSSTENLSEEPLKNELRTITGNGYNSLLYNTARDHMFMIIDNERVNGQGAAQNTVEGVYTGIRAVGYVDRSDVQSNFSFNTEHTFPQGLFSSLEPMKSDLHHLFPTDDLSNNMRASDPFGVVTNPTWSSGGSKSNGTVFEPRDKHKGRAARAMLYFVVRYQNYANFLNSQEGILKLWNKTHLPDNIEINRNNDIYSFQNNRNPFIDYPQLADRISAFSNLSIAPVLNSIDFSEDSIIYGIVGTGTQAVYDFVIVNSGNTDIQLSQFSLSNNTEFAFVAGNNDRTIIPGESAKVRISVTPSSGFALRETLNFSTNLPGMSNLSIPIFVNDSILTTVSDFFSDDFEVFPNPFNEFIEIQTHRYGNYSAEVYDLTGRIMVKFDVESTRIHILKELPAGIYYIRITEVQSNELRVKKLVKTR